MRHTSAALSRSATTRMKKRKRIGWVPDRFERLAGRIEKYLNQKLGAPAIPVKCLLDGSYYIGFGRNSDVGIWYAKASCFWVICINDGALNPASYPKGCRRQVRLKQERHISTKGGTFKPISRVLQ